MTPWEILKRPFAFDEIEVKCQTLKKETPQESGGKFYGMALATPYFDARAVMERLDEAFTPALWRFEVRELMTKPAFIGRLTVWDGDREVVREDGAELTDIEAVKGGISGAFKRCFSMLGNRTLYSVNLGWYECEVRRAGNDFKFKCWTKQAYQIMRSDYERQVKVINPATGREINMPAGKANEEVTPAGAQIIEMPAVRAQAPVVGRKPGLSDREIEAAEFVQKTLKLDKESLKTFKGLTMASGGWVECALEAKKEGVTDYDLLIAFMATHKPKNGQVPVGAK